MTNNTMEFKQKCSFRWVFFIGGLFWTLAIPAAYIIFIYGGLFKETPGNIVVATLGMALLFLGTIVMTYNGLNDIISNGKKNLVVTDDGLQLIINGFKNKGTVFSFTYEQISKFYFVSDGTIVDKKTGKISIKQGSSGSINFSINKKYLPDSIMTPKQQKIMQRYKLKSLDFSSIIYNALPAAQFILSKLNNDQIDHTRNELTKSGNVVIIDEDDAYILEEQFNSDHQENEE